jgi:hypothetical protein
MAYSYIKQKNVKICNGNEVYNTRNNHYKDIICIRFSVKRGPICLLLYAILSYLHCAVT